MTYQPRREMMNIGQDTNGDGIPDGAEVTIRRTATDPVAGHTTVTSARFTKKPAQERRPMEPTPEQPVSGLPPAQAPVPAENQMPNENPATNTGNPWEQFSRRTDRAYDSMIGGTRTNSDVNPVAPIDRRRHLERQADDLSISPALRASAANRLAMMDTTAGRAADLASAERRTLITAQGQAAKAETDLQGKQIVADAMRDQAATTASGRVGAAEATAQGKQIELDQKAQLEREKMAQRKEIEKSRLEMWNNRDKDKADLHAARDKNTLQTKAESYLDKQYGMNQKTLRQYIVETYDQQTGKQKPDATIDPVFEDRLAFLNKKWTEINGKPYMAESTNANPTAPDMTPENKTAYDWAKANPNDPRSANILKKLGVQ